jgi:hypothetical protein
MDLENQPTWKHAYGVNLQQKDWIKLDVAANSHWRISSLIDFGVILVLVYPVWTISSLLREIFSSYPG